jgi:hypothetical protein
MQQEYYHADYGCFKLLALPGLEEYVQKCKKSVEEQVKPAY